MRGLSALGLTVLACGRLGFDADSPIGTGGTTDGGLPPCTSSVCQCNIDSDCPQFEYCSAHAGEHTCECVSGYAKQPDGTCQWAGVVADPGFQQTTIWSAAGATLAPTLTEAGMVEPGAATISGAAQVSQTIVMPRLSRSQLLVMQISSQSDLDVESGTNPPTAGIGRTDWLGFASNATWVVERRCLNAASYAPESSTGAGVAMPLRIAQATPTIYNTQIDHFEIQPAMPGECTMPGPVVNGDAEGSGNWAFNASGSSGVFAGYAAGAGSRGSRGVRVYVPKVCDLAQASMSFSLVGADQLPSPAMTFYLRATAGEAPPMAATVAVTGSAQTIELCLPAASRGEPGAFGTGLEVTGTCGGAAGLEAVVDDVDVIDEPACGTDPDFADPGFESGFPASDAGFSPPASSVRVTTSASQAHSGNGALRIGASQTCAAPEWDTIALPIPPSPNGNAAVEFYYRATPRVNFPFVVRLGGGIVLTLTQDNAWHRGVACFDPSLANRPQLLRFMLDGSGTCGQNVPEEYAFIDDLAVVNDPSCP
jgi:hypothetical protein